MTLDNSGQTQLSDEEMLKRVRMLRFKVHEKKIEEVWTDLLAENFEMLLIKGWAAAQFYPEPYQREFSDIDIAVNPLQYDAVEKFLKENPNKYNYNIDLHRGFRRHDTLSFEEILAASKSVWCGAVKIRVPCAEDHLRILCVHWLTDGGAYREKLWDIYYGIANRQANFDWERLLDSVSSTRRQWIVCTIGLAHKYLGLKIDETPIAAEASKIPRWLTNAVENEWRSKVRLKPLNGVRYQSGKGGTIREFKNFLRSSFDDRKDFWEQLRKRLPPNPLYATVDVEGEFDDKTRFFYQLKSFYLRLRKFGKVKDV